MRRILGLFTDFLQFGCFTFGGGWSIIAQMKRKYIDGAGEITTEELLDLTSVARSIPGTMIGNVAMLFGYRQAGVLGGIACVTGMVTPPLLVLSVIAWFYTAFQHNFWIQAAMGGVRAAIVPIILTAAAGLVKGGFKYPPCVLVAVLCFALYIFLNVSCVWLVVIGLFSGLIICGIYEKTGTPDAGNAGARETEDRREGAR